MAMAIYYMIMKKETQNITSDGRHNTHITPHTSSRPS